MSPRPDRKYSRSQLVLSLGSIILLGSIVLSLGAVFNLQSRFLERRANLESQLAYYHLSHQIKNWVISHTQPTSKLEGRVLNGSHETVYRALENVLDGPRPTDPQQLEARRLLAESVSLLLNNPSVDLEVVHSIDEALLQLIEAENLSASRHGSAMIQSIDRLAFGSVFSVVLALALIGLSINFKAREDTVKINLIKKLQLLKEEADSASKLKSKFLSTVSHEIRTPLNGIIGLSDVLLNSPLPKESVTMAQTINRSGKTLLRIINDILDFSKIEAGKTELVNTRFSIVDVLDQVIMTLSPHASAKNINLSYEIDPSLPKYVHSDPERVAQILFNLIGNAIKFTEIGSVVVRISLVGKSEDRCDIEFSIQDTGLGISPHDTERLFVPFCQSNKQGTQGEIGTGLGLSISQSLVRALGGEIHVMSRLGYGSRFWFVLPLTKFSKQTVGLRLSFAASKATNPSNHVKPLSVTSAEPSILIVEDNPTNQVVAQAMLERLGIQSVTVSNGEEAIALLEKESFDAILMDCQMPILDGYETTRILRERNVKTPIIAMTAYAYDEDEKRCLDAGMNAFVPKPVDIHQLRETLATVLQSDKDSFNRQILKGLDLSIGELGRRRVVKAFLSTIPTFSEEFNAALDHQDMKSINRLGHRFKGAARSIGGEEFSLICERLEASSSISEMHRLKERAIYSLAQLEKKLLDYA